MLATERLVGNSVGNLRFELHQWLIEANDQLNNIDCNTLPIEAELHLAMTRNKIAQLLPIMDGFITRVNEAQYHYHKIFEVLFDVRNETEYQGNEVKLLTKKVKKRIA